MSIDIHEEPWLRDALSDIVGTEPAMASTLIDDVRRGESARASVRRRRVTTVAVAAVLALMAVPAGFLLRAQPHAAAPPVSSVSATPTGLSPSPTPRPSASGDGFVADDDWESRVLTVLGGRVSPVLQHADVTAARLLVSGRLVQGDAGTFVLASVDQGSGAAAQLASPPCGLDDPRCVVLLPWGRVTTAQGPAWVSLVDITYTDVPHRTRVASVIRGDTTVMLSSDSRDVSADFSYGASTAPGLAPDVIVADAQSMPLPESMRTAAGRPTATPPGVASGNDGSASATATSGTGGPQTAQDRAFAESVPCARDQVNVTYGGADGATGLNIYTFLVRNVSQKPCGLVGRATVTIPGLALRYAAGSGSFAGSDPTVVTVFLLQPGATADFSVTKWRCDYGTGARASTIDIRVNSAAVATTLAFDGTTRCTGGPASDPGNGLTVYGWHEAH